MNIVREVLEEKYVNIFIKDFYLKEDEDRSLSLVKCTVSFSDERTPILINGQGHGLIDALFNCMMAELIKEYSSLGQVEFDDFSMRVKFKNLLTRKTDAPVEIKIALKNKQDKRIYFFAEARSMVFAATSAVRQAFEYLINAERAFLCLLADVEDATTRNREDLLNIYTNQLAELVKIVSYEELAKKYRA